MKYPCYRKFVRMIFFFTTNNYGDWISDIHSLKRYLKINATQFNKTIGEAADIVLIVSSIKTKYKI